MKDVHAKFSPIIDLLNWIISMNESNFESIQERILDSSFMQDQSSFNQITRAMFNAMHFRSDVAIYNSKLCLFIKKSNLEPPNFFIKKLSNSTNITQNHMLFFRKCVDNNVFTLDQILNAITHFFLELNSNSQLFYDQLKIRFFWFLYELKIYRKDIYKEILIFFRRFECYEDINCVKLFLASENFQMFNKLLQQEYIENTLAYYISKDDIETFQEKFIDINSTIPILPLNHTFSVIQHPTLLQFASFYSSIRCLKFMLLNNALINKDTEFGSIKHLEIEQNFINVSSDESEDEENVQLELKNDDFPSLQKLIKLKHVGDYAIAGGNIETITLLNQNKVDFERCLKIAIAFFRNDLFEWIMDNFIQGPIKKISKILYISIVVGNIEIVEFLQKKIPRVLSIAYKDIFPIHTAIHFRQKEIVDFILIKSSKSLFLKNPFNQTPLIQAIDEKSSKLVKTIIDKQESNDFMSQNNFNDMNPLHYACCYGNTKIVLLLLEKDISLLDNKYKNTPLICSIKYSQTKIFDYLISDDRIDINIITPKGITAPHTCIKYDKVEMFQKLLNTGKLNLNLIDGNGYPFLHYSIYRNAQNFIKMLIPLSWIDINLQAKNGEYLLHVAVKSKCLTMVKFVISLTNEQFLLKDNYGNTPLHYAAQIKSKRIFKALLKCEGIDINSQNNKGNTVLHIAIKKQRTKHINKILQMKNINLNIQNKKGETALFLAVKKQNSDYVNQLLQCPKIDVNITESLNGMSPLHMAVSLKDKKSASLLLESSNVNINIQNKDGLTPLHIAAQKKLNDFIRILFVNPSIDLLVKDNFHKTALHYEVIVDKSWFGLKMFNPYMYTSKISNETIRKFLIKNIESAYVPDDDGNTPLHIALTEPSFDGNILKSCNVKKIEIRNNNGQTLLHMAAGAGNIDAVLYILDLNPKMLNQKDNNGDTPLHFAAKGGRVYTVSRLVLFDGIDRFARNKQNKTPLDLVRNDMKNEFVKFFK